MDPHDHIEEARKQFNNNTKGDGWPIGRRHPGDGKGWLDHYQGKDFSRHLRIPLWKRIRNYFIRNNPE